ncbi:MAG: efflux RND transporter periplasmic adaptor subunit, partial [Bacteroidales bacterium]|nr:efflux RND transporter periplasmic adaptor subunit [Bacteroidales bacterium]
MNNLFKISATIIITGLLMSCGGKKEATSVKDASVAEKVQTQVLAKEKIARQLELSSTLEGYESMSISPSLTGNIEHIYVEVGSRVSRGQLLVRMDQTQL